MHDRRTPLVTRRGPMMAGLMAALLVSAAVASAQMELATIQGTVTDESGQPLEGVRFTLRDLTRGRETETTSDEDGRFYRRGLQAVEYEITVEKEGYQPIQDRIRLNAGIDRRYDFKLAKASPAGAEEFARGVEAFNRGDSAAAAAAFEEAVAKAPDAPEAHVNLALAYLRLSRTAEAIAQLEQAAALAPNQPNVLFQLGGAYVEAQMNDKAIDALEKGLAQQPDLTNELAWQATITLGAVYFAEGDNAKATASFQKALDARPDAVVAKLGLGKCAFSQGDVARALDYFTQVVQTAPGTPEAAEAETFIAELKKAKSPGA